MEEIRLKKSKNIYQIDSYLVNNEDSDNFLRIYKNKFELLKFELEIKKAKTRNYAKF